MGPDERDRHKRSEDLDEVGRHKRTEDGTPDDETPDVEAHVHKR
jgi:hypothetical protein